jgi:hypothetical protein
MDLTRLVESARRRAGALGLGLLLCALAVGGAWLLSTHGGPGGTQAAHALPDYGDPILAGRRRATVVEPEAGVAGTPAVAAPTQPEAGAPTSVPPSDEEIRRELKAGGLTTGSHAGVTAAGLAIAPLDAPPDVIAMINAGNQIARAPYRYGGGHATWEDSAYDCSGSVSFALAAAGLLDGPLDSTALARWGAPGPGRWVTIYANAGHAWMTVAGLRFDTSGEGPNRSRWQPAGRGTGGFTVRHPPGL